MDPSLGKEFVFERKMPNTSIVLVETVSLVRVRYLVETPSASIDFALDTVSFNEAKEFSQNWLGETITSHRAVSKKEALELIRAEHARCSSWTDEEKIKTFVTPWKDSDNGTFVEK